MKKIIRLEILEMACNMLRESKESSKIGSRYEEEISSCQIAIL